MTWGSMMKTFAELALVVGTAMLSAHSFLADGPPKNQDGRPPSIAAQTAATALDAQMYLRHAKDWLATLSFRIQAGLPTPKQEAHDLASGIVRDVQACDQALDKLNKQLEKNPDVADRIGRIKQQNAKVQKLNVRFAAECAKETRNASAISDLSIETWHELDAAEVELSALLQTLKIDWLIPPNPTAASKAGDGSPKASSPPAAAAATPGNGFRPHTAAVQHQSAVDNARLLYHYATTQTTPPEATILEHLSEIERQLIALKKEYAKLNDVAQKENELKAQIETVEEQNAKAQEQVTRLTKSVKAGMLNPAQLKETSALIYQNLRAAQNQQYRVIRNLGVQKPWYPRGMDPNGPTYDPEMAR